MSGDSLQDYKNKTPFIGAGNAANNFNRNHEATKKPMDGFKSGATTWSSSMPQVGWNSWSSKDPIVSSLSCSGGSGGGSIGLTIFGAAMAAAPVVLQTVSLFANKKSDAADGNFSRKEIKNINKNSENAEDISTALSSTVETANSLDDNASLETLKKTNENLMDSIKQASEQKKDAAGNAETAAANIRTLNADKAKEKTNYDSLLNNKANLTKSIADLEKIDTTKMTDEQKAQLKTKISTLKKQLKETEKKLDESNKKLTDFDDKIAVQQQIKDNNTKTANNLDKQISQANTLVTTLNKKIENHKDNN